MISKLKSLVASGKPKEAIDIIAEFIAQTDKDKYNELILLSGEISRNHGFFAQGLIPLEDYKLSNSKTNYALLSIIDTIDTKSFTEVQEKQKNKPLSPKTKLLFLAAQPSDLAPLNLEKEYLEIRRIFKKKRQHFEITEEFDVTIDSFFESIREEDPHIIHFSGFGTKDAVILSRKTDRSSHDIPYEFLASAFKLLKGKTEFVFINTQGSCLFAKVISRFIPYTIGLKGTITDKDAISFSSGFYSALAIEKNYEKAFEFGKKLLKAKSLNDIIPPSNNIPPENNEITPEPNVVYRNINAEESEYFLYKNGKCEDDKDTPEDFYVDR